MKRPISDPKFWAERLKVTAEGDRHKAVYVCSRDTWQDIEIAHRVILRKTIKPTDRVLDLGCGWGRLIDLLPTNDKTPPNRYMGIDLSPDFIALAKCEKPGHRFACGKFLDTLPLLEEQSFDWGVLVSIRGMMIRELSNLEWNLNHAEMKRVCKNLLYLEYDPKDPGEIELCQPQS